MHRLLPFLLLAMVACGTADPGATARVEGQVLAGPICPVETPEGDCDPRPWVGTVRATAEADGGIYETQTDDQGRYGLEVPPGVYTVVAVTDGGSPPTGIPQTVQVLDAQPLRLDLEVDTGIR